MDNNLYEKFIDKTFYQIKDPLETKMVKCKCGCRISDVNKSKYNHGRSQHHKKYIDLKIGETHCYTVDSTGRPSKYSNGHLTQIEIIKS